MRAVDLNGPGRTVERLRCFVVGLALKNTLEHGYLHGRQGRLPVMWILLDFSQKAPDLDEQLLVIHRLFEAVGRTCPDGLDSCRYVAVIDEREFGDAGNRWFRVAEQLHNVSSISVEIDYKQVTASYAKHFPAESGRMEVLR